MTFATETAYADQLTDAQLAHFQEQGYLIFPSWIPATDIERLKQEIDHWQAGGVDDRYAQAGAPISDRTGRQLDFPGHWQLCTHPALMAIVERLLGPGFAHHHLHTAKHLPGDHGVAWHHDYEQNPQTNRNHGMVHTFWYLNGLDGTIGDLLVIPGSHSMILERGALTRWGFSDLPGTVRIDHIPPGSMVIVHSAALHARAPKPGGDPGKARYFIDSSYCQAGVRWPHYSGWLNAHARVLADGRAAAAGREHLFRPEHFYNTDTIDWSAYHQVNQGSMALSLLEK
jgi:hypothetical protein